MTKTEQDRLNAAVKAYAEKYDSVKYEGSDEYEAVIEAAQPLLEKEPRVGMITEHDGLLVAIDAIELMDTPYIVQKGKKPVKLEEGYVVLRMLPTRDQYMGGLFAGISTGFNEYINSLRVDCDD